MMALPTRRIAGMRVDDPSFEGAVERVAARVDRGGGAYVCVANVHMTMEAFDDIAFREIVERADMVTPDGMALVWALRLLGRRHAERVRGPDLMPAVLAWAERTATPVGFYGAAPDTLERLTVRCQERFPRLRIAYVHAPPFRPLTADEDAAVVAAIRSSGARIVFVGLVCPKQERWMAQHVARLDSVLIGVGAAFDMHAGTLEQAPAWLQRAGLEWAFRLVQEPRRLWRRYLHHNPRFVWLFVRQLLLERVRAPAERGGRRDP